MTPQSHTCEAGPAGDPHTRPAPPARWQPFARRLITPVCVLLLMGLPFLVFWRIWWPDETLRLTFHHGDFVDQHFPMRSFVAQEYRNLRLPLWSPYTLSGEPVAAVSIFAPFYPLGLWEALWPELPFLALELEVLFYLGLAGTFTFFFVAEATGSRAAGLLSGAAFGLGGFLTSYPMLQMVILQVALWMPAGLWLLERALRRRSPCTLALAGAVLGIGVLGGHFQTFLYIAYTTAAYYALRCWQLRTPVRTALYGALIVVLCVLGIGAPQWLPSLQIAPLSTRGRLSYEELSSGFELSEWAGILRPNIGQWSPLYVGLVPLLLACVALITVRQRRVAFWGGVAVLSLLTSLGSNGFLYPILYRVAPGFSLFRGQERAAFTFSFALAVLAGTAYAYLQRREPRLRYAAPLLVALTVLDLSRANGFVLQTPPTERWDAVTPAVEYLQAHSAWPERVSSESLLPLDGNAGLRYRIRDVVGNGPLRLAAYDDFIGTVPETRWWRMLNVGHVVTRRELHHPALDLVFEDEELGHRIYRLDMGRSEAWIVHYALVARDQDEALRLTADPNLDPFRVAIVEGRSLPALSPAAAPESVRVAELWTGKVVVHAQLSSPGIVVLSEVDYPGWRLRVNGEPADSLRAYGLLRAVPLEAGEWHLEWRFRPFPVYVGLLWALATVGTVLVWIARCRARADRTRSETTTVSANPRDRAVDQTKGA